MWIRGKMDYFESVVFEYLRSYRILFINIQSCIQLNPSDNPDTSGPHWYCSGTLNNYALLSKNVFDARHAVIFSASEEQQSVQPVKS